MKDYDPSNPAMLIGKDGLLNNLKKALIERAMNAELDIHLGYRKNQANANCGSNYRNGNSSKTVITEDDRINIEVPRDRNSYFEPLIVRKGQRTFTGFDDKIISMYARGMSVAEITGHLQEIYGVEVSGDFISNVTDAIIDEVESWQNRSLDKVYPIVFLDCIVVKCKEDNRVINKSVYLALGVNMEGQKEILGFWIANNEGARACFQTHNPIARHINAMIMRLKKVDESLSYLVASLLNFLSFRKNLSIMLRCL